MATIDCVYRSVTLAPSGEAEMIYLGIEPSTYLGMCSVSPVRRLRSGCVAYLAMAINTSVEPLKIEDIPVAYEFPDVFSVSSQGCLWSGILTLSLT